MSKFARTAAIVVGAVALAATGIGAVVGATGAVGFLGVSGATWTAIGSVASVGSAILSVAAGAAKPKGTVGGNATKFTINKESGYPYIIGRTALFGFVTRKSSP